MFFKRLALAIQDIYSGALLINIWFFLAWQDIRQRYTRSVIGPFWITISTGVLIIAMGPLYGTLLKQDMGSYLQHLAISMIIWNFIAGYVNESCGAFISAEGYIKQIKLPLTVHLLRVLTKNLLYFMHNVLIIIVLLFIYPPESLKYYFLLPAAFLLVFGNLFWVGFLLAILCTRFRDIPQIVTNLMQLLFFMTPILWKVDMLGKHRWAAEVNPFYHLIEIIRGPLLGGQVSALPWLVSIAMIAVGSLLALLVLSRFRSRIPYWL